MKTFFDFSFDFARPNLLPKAIEPQLKGHGIAKEDIVLCVRADLDEEKNFCERYLLFDKSNLYILTGQTLHAGGQATFSERAFKVLSIDGLDGFKVEDLASSSCLTVQKNGKKMLLAQFSRAYREDFVQLAKYADEYCRTGVFTPVKEDAKQKKQCYCPTCGLRYADPDAKICPKCRKRSGVIKRTFALFTEYRVKLFFVLLSLIISSALAIVIPYLSAGFLYDQVLDPAGIWYGKIVLAVITIIATRLLSTAVTSVHSVLNARLAADMAYKLRKTIFSSINRLSLSFFVSRKTGGLMTQIDNDAQTIYWFFCDELPQFAVSFTQVIAVSVIMFLINPLLALATVFLLPLTFFLVKRMFKRMDILYNRRYGRKRSMNSALSDVLGGVRVVKAFSGEKNEKLRFERKSRDLAQADLNRAAYEAKNFPLITLLLRLGTVLVWAVGGVMILLEYNTPGLIGATGVLTYGTLATFLSYVSMVYEPLFGFADTISMAAESLNSMSRLIEVMDASPEVTEKENALSFDEMKGDITFDKVGFSYITGVPVLDNISFDLKAGKTLGIVGRTGAGKSTLVSLLTRLYDVSEGRILIDGVDLKDLSFAYLHRNISFVSQDTYLFSGTILENIRYARPEASLEEVFAASAAAGADEFIMKLRDGFDTRIGQGYADLSGGEKQRLSIARAILKNPKILILDEATAAMDTRTEQKISSALASFSRGRTTIMIAHRLSTLKDADELIVLDEKTVAERGKPLDLIKQKGIYFKLYSLQMEAMHNIGVEEENEGR